MYTCHECHGLMLVCTQLLSQPVALPWVCACICMWSAANGCPSGPWAAWCFVACAWWDFCSYNLLFFRKYTRAYSYLLNICFADATQRNGLTKPCQCIFNICIYLNSITHHPPIHPTTHPPPPPNVSSLQHVCSFIKRSDGSWLVC